MQTVEIKYLRKPQIGSIILGTIMILVINYIFFFSGMKPDNTYKKWAISGMTLLLVYTIYKDIKKLRVNKPALIFSEQFLKIEEKGKYLTLPWNEINSFVIKDEKAYDKLVLQTKQGEKKVILDQLDKRVAEIEALMNEYCGR